MSERLPVTARGTEPARATVVGSVFDLHGLRCRSDPATAAADETEMQAAVSRPNLAFPLLPMQVEIGGRGDLGVELRRRELLRRAARRGFGVCAGAGACAGSVADYAGRPPSSAGGPRPRRSRRCRRADRPG